MLVLKRKLPQDLINFCIHSSNFRDVSIVLPLWLEYLFNWLVQPLLIVVSLIDFKKKITFPKNQPRSHVTGGHWRSNPEPWKKPSQTPQKVHWFLAFSHFASKKTKENGWSLTGKGSSTLSMVGCSNVVVKNGIPGVPNLHLSCVCL